MADDVYWLSVSYLTEDAVNVLCRLNRKKVIPSNDLKLPRDWRGLAALTGTTVQDINHHGNMVKCILETWVQNDGDTATVRKLFHHLENIDRYDIKDDLLALSEGDRLIICDGDEDTSNVRVEYDALVLYVDADQEFIDTMLEKMTEKGVNLLTKPYQRRTRLTHPRCRHTVLVYSPAFFEATGRKFLSDYENHTWAMESKAPEDRYRLIPCVYKKCMLPTPLQFYFPLYVNTVAYNFWDQLAWALNSHQTYKLRLRVPAPTPLSSVTTAQDLHRSNEPSNDAAQPSIISNIARWYRQRTNVVI